MAVTGNINVVSSTMGGDIANTEHGIEGDIAIAQGNFTGAMDALKVELKAAIQQKNGSMTAILKRKAETMYDIAVRYGYAGTEEQWIQGIMNAIDVVDNLTTDDGSKPLSARQGKVLNEKINARTQWYDL